MLRAASAIGPAGLAAGWPIAGTAPSFAVEGRAWMGAAHDVSPEWTDGTERAWRHAWLLLSAVLDEESLSPFAVPALRGH